MTASHLILGVIVAALVLALIRDGRGGAQRWLKAKFLGQVEAT